MNSNNLVNKQKQTNKMKIEFQNSVAKFSFLCFISDINIAWINTCNIYIKSIDVSTTRHFLVTNFLFN